MKQLYSLCLLMAFCTAATAQVDPHFSQTFAFPNYVNPAFTGVFDGDYRATVVYRNQWADISGGLKSAGFMADAVTSKNVNIGMNFFQQTSGTGYAYQTGYASVSYNGVRFGEDNTKMIAFGIQAGFISRRFDATKFKTEDQWNNLTGYVAGTPTTDLLKANSSFLFDAGAGVIYCDMNPRNRVNPYIGFSVSHLTSPEDHFLSSTAITKIAQRITGHASFGIYVNENLTVTPTLLYMKQGSAEEKMAGAYLTGKVNENLSLLGGANYRFNDAVVPFIGLEMGRARLGASYDVSTSDISRVVSASNSFELSLTYVFKPNGDYKYLNCPRF